MPVVVPLSGSASFKYTKALVESREKSRVGSDCARSAGV